MFREFARRLGAPILTNMTEFGRTPHFTKDQFAEMGCKMVIWPVSSLRMAARAQSELYATLAKLGSAESLLPRMQTRAELYETIRYHEFESLDASIAASVAP
jgi:methylisocitrate lyase